MIAYNDIKVLLRDVMAEGDSEQDMVAMVRTWLRLLASAANRLFLALEVAEEAFSPSLRHSLSRPFLGGSKR